MKDFKIFVTIACVALLFTACNQAGTNSSKIITLDLTKDSDKISLDIADLCENINLVKLETSDKSLISRGAFLVGEKYILVIQKKSILQFSANGKFIGTISKHGKGPGEYTQIDAYDLDNKAYFYYHDFSKNYINRYNLKNSKQCDKIPFKAKGYLSNLIALNDSTLAILPDQFAEYGYRYFFQNHKGKILEGIKKENVPHPGSWAGASSSFIKLSKESILYRASDSDTIYNIKGSAMIAHTTYTIPKPIKKGVISTKTTASPKKINSKWGILTKGVYDITKANNTISMDCKDYSDYFYKKDDKQLKRVENYIIKWLGVEIIPKRIFFTNTNKLVAKLEAFELKMQIEKTLEENKLSKEQRERLQQLNSEISEDDNPILFIGDIKI